MIKLNDALKKRPHGSVPKLKVVLCSPSLRQEYLRDKLSVLARERGLELNLMELAHTELIRYLCTEVDVLAHTSFLET